MATLVDFNNAMQFIEHNLTGSIDFGLVARTAGCSQDHLRRMFSYLSGLPLGEYIRRRRLSEAALRLRDSSLRVIDIALMYGYDSPDAFTRAFVTMHGVTPTEVRAGAAVRSFQPMTFQMTIRGGDDMTYRIVKKDAFYIAGTRKRITLVYHGVNPQMDDMWTRLTMDDYAELKSLCDTDPRGIITASAALSPDRAEGSELDQYIGVAVTHNPGSRWEVLPVESSEWAVFTAIGGFPHNLQDIWGRVYSEWFPSTGYESTGGPELLWNEGPDTSKPDFKSELWIPVRKGK